MTHTRPLGPLPALGLGLTLIFAQPGPAAGQDNASTSSGSGSRRPSTGLGNTEASTPPTGAIPGIDPLQGRPSGPRSEPMLQPRVVRPGEVEGLFGTGGPPLVREALSITDPGERSLAMVRIARTSIFLGRPDLGHIALFQAADDSRLEPIPTLRDQRLVNVIVAALALAEEHMREIAIVQTNIDAGGPTLPPPINTDRLSNLERGRQEWDLAFRLAFAIGNRSARTETLYRVVESESLGSSSLVREPFRIIGGRPDPTKLPPALRTFSDGLLETAIAHALQIERPVWRDRALVAIASNAATSGQFARATQASTAIPQPEVRTDSLLKVAENEVVFGRPDDATVTYAAAARSIAMVPNTDPRETLVGVLIDSLIAFGRFDDARAATSLYLNPANPPIALAAVAESQGRRNLADSARKWIEREPSAELRSLLFRKLNDGLLAAVELRRSAELSRPSQ